MDCLIPFAPAAQSQPISADDLALDNFRNIDFKRERLKPESPPVALSQRAFYVHAVTNFAWTVLRANEASVAIRICSSAISGCLFTLRTFHLNFASASALNNGDGQNMRRAATHRTPTADKPRKNSSPSAGTGASTAPPNRQTSAGAAEHAINAPFVMSPTHFARRLISRAIELECIERSVGLGVKYQSVDSWFAEEWTKSEGAVIGPDVEPCEFGLFRNCLDPQIPRFQLRHASASDVNELAWLLGSIDDHAGACAFTKYVEARQPRQIFLELTEEIPSHPFKLTDPWRIAWKWLSRPLLIPYARQAYLEAVALTWAPVPESIEGTWIYTLVVDEPENDSESSSVDETTNLSPFDTSEEVMLNVNKQADDLALDQRRRGFTTFIWDVVAFWKGFYAILESDIASWRPANEDLSLVGAAILRYRIGNPVCTRVPLTDLILDSWKAIDYFRLSCFSSHELITSSIVLELPHKLRTLSYKLKDVQKKDRILFYGYQLIPNESGKRNSYTFGISSGGLLSCPALSYLKERCQFLLEVEEGFTTNVNYLGMIFEALQGTGIAVEYDEVYARFFLMSPAVNALPDEARRIFYRSAHTKRDRLKFSRMNASGRLGSNSSSPDVCATASTTDGRSIPQSSSKECFNAPQSNRGLYKLITKLSESGGLLLLGKVEGTSTEYFIHTEPNKGAFVSGVTFKTRTKYVKKAPLLLGRMKKIYLSTGIYKVKDMVAAIEQAPSPYARQRVNFLKKFTDLNNLVEIFEVDENTDRGTSDLHCLQFEMGDELRIIRLAEECSKI